MSNGADGKRLRWKPDSRVLIAWDGKSWYVRGVACVKADMEHDEQVYYCDRPIANDCRTLRAAIDAAMDAEEDES